MRQGVPIGVGGGQAGENHLGRMYGMSGMRGGVSGGRCLRMGTKDGRMPVWAFAAGVAILFFGVVGYAKISGHWKSEIPQAVYGQLVPRANEASHPMPGDPSLQQ